MTSHTPQKIWAQSSAGSFLAESGLGSTPTTQQMMCYMCAAEGVYDIPSKIAMVNGNSVCVEHILS